MSRRSERRAAKRIFKADSEAIIEKQSEIKQETNIAGEGSVKIKTNKLNDIIALSTEIGQYTQAFHVKKSECDVLANTIAIKKEALEKLKLAD